MLRKVVKNAYMYMEWRLHPLIAEYSSSILSRLQIHISNMKRPCNDLPTSGTQRPHSPPARGSLRLNWMT
jgi:hypothetical protein